MDKIKNTHLDHLRNDEHFQFMQFVLALVKETGAAALKVEPQNAALAAAHAREDEALKKITKSALTVQITEADHARDLVFRGLVDAVLSAEHHYSPTAREAAVRLGIVLDTYGNVAQKSHIEETSAVYNLVKELTEKHADDVESLYLSGWIEELDRRNTAVEKLLSGRADEGASKSSLILKAVRAEVDAAWLAFAAMIDAQALVATVAGDIGDVPMYESFVRRLNERIDLLNQTLAVRRGKAAAARAKKKAEEEAAKKAQAENQSKNQ